MNIVKLVDTLHLEDLKNPMHPSIFDENDSYDMLIIRLPIIEEKLELISVGFIITHDNSYYYIREEEIFEELGNRFEAPYKILDTTIDNLLKSFETYRDLIIDMEEALYLNKTKKSFINRWLELKRTIVRVERVLMHASSTMDKMIEYYTDTKDFPINHYMDLHEHLERTLHSAKLQLSKLDYLYNFHSAQTNEKMNHLIYILTIISAIFLPLNLVVGFFGMNTSGLPFSEGLSGTGSVGIFMIFLSIFMLGVIYFVKKRV
ncbi:Mg2+ transporter protein, CorA-like protein [Sulfurimonas denitrificans DSM 1251]|uniref:Mg2+ transporter protein, CorA-like protein n=1 Tax=Sulfurimonas denitrificans (strain ATCC 33889 / DSM 1251) TaxID=326298 RepID=Q30PW3_SULDN|nr:CorA family divalent cation transporter [Sulfurimonas denitrificans]ABB44968.1 Mg2+ transporter protein, CorA-like protein [Sulfurimonas denitrificans DSM 1251]MDD3442630.1 CorA family divalent cation transporter [Sulfurimonas denitrificans]